jgi:hypothetical protein
MRLHLCCRVHVGPQERSHLETSAAAQVAATEAAAAAASQALRAKLEGRIASITTCLAQLTAQEEAREAKRTELAAQVRVLLGQPGVLLLVCFGAVQHMCCLARQQLMHTELAGRILWNALCCGSRIMVAANPHALWFTTH